MKPSAPERPTLSNVLLVQAGEDPPNEYDASVLVNTPECQTGKLVTELTCRWQQKGLLVIFVPSPDRSNEANEAWKRHWGDRADVVVFWVPDAAHKDQAIDENLGRWKESGRVVVGSAYGHFRHDRINECGPVVAHDLAETARLALDHIGPGARRAGPHRDVPLILWRTSSFRTWLTSQEDAGNELLRGRVLWTYQIGANRDLVFFWAFESTMFIAAEQRENIAEVILCRPDISSVVAYRRAPDIADTEVIIVREYRSPSTSSDGFVRELPGGSAYTPSATTIEHAPIIEQAIAEFYEETGIALTPDRFRLHQSRQLAATMTAHKQDVIAVELTAEETATARSDTSTHGVLADSERTYVEVHRYADLIEQQLVDWSTLGAISSVLFAAHSTAASQEPATPSLTP